MRSAMALIFLVLIVALGLAVGGGWFVVQQGLPGWTVANGGQELPTLVPLPSFTASPTYTASPTATSTVAPSATPTASQTATHTLAASATLSVRLLSMVAIMPGIPLTPTAAATDFPFGTVLLPAPPPLVEPLPDATLTAPPYEGWYSFESDHPRVRYATRWEARQVVAASRGQYHRTENVTSTVTFAFEGEGLRVRYVAARNMGSFELWVDGVKLDTVDAYAPELHFPGTQVYSLGKGVHQLEIRPGGARNAASEGDAVGLDAIQVFRGDAHTLILSPPPAVTPVPSTTVASAARIDVVSTPASVQTTITPPAPRMIRVTLIIAYDENGNKAVDPAEGVLGIPVRIIDSRTNRALAYSQTDGQGYVQLEVLSDADARLVVPYFGKVWVLPRRSTGGASTSNGSTASFTLLLKPGNQPGLIP